MEITENQRYWAMLIASLVVAYLAYVFPARQMPLDYGAMLSRSVPLAAIWVLIVGFNIWRHKIRGLWLLLGSPAALYWPIWLLLNKFPPCYYAHGCE